MEKLNPIKWNGSALEVLDQRKLPHDIEWFMASSVEGVHMAIKDMLLRGAPLIGFAGIYGMALSSLKENQAEFEKDAAYLTSARPTAVNLKYEIDRCLTIGPNFEQLINWASSQVAKLEQDNLNTSLFVVDDLKKRYPTKSSFNALTICNTGRLACGCRGTALGVVETLHDQGQLGHVYATETRPYLQGARLTAFECEAMNIPYSVIVEGAVSELLRNRKVDFIVAGADRIAANGDTANKVGTGTFSIVAKHFGIPFYIVAPTSSFDLGTASGAEIEIEMRPPSEIKQIKGNNITPVNSNVWNPSFDITFAENISGMACEQGLISPVDKNRVRSIVTIN